MHRSRQYRLAVVNSHPIQYFAPLYRRLAMEPSIDLTVYYCSRAGVDEYIDNEFGRTVRWDVPLLDGYEYKFLPNLRKYEQVAGFASLINPAIVPEVFHGDYDAIWLHSYHYATLLIALLAARIRHVPILYRTESSLTYDSLVQRPWPIRVTKPIFLRLLFKQIAGFLSIGTLNAEFYKHHGVPPTKMFHVPYTVDNEYFMRSAAKLAETRDARRAEIGIRADDVVFVFAAKMTTQKSPLALLRAYEAVSSRGKHLLMAGDGALRADAEAFVKARNVPGVHFLGFINQSELPAIYSLGDIFVRPDGVYKGDWGLTVNEAMACGLAIIATDAIGATADLVANHGNGLIVKFGDLAELTQAMQSLANDLDLCRAMGKRSAYTISGWSNEQCVAGLLLALETVVGRQTRRHFGQSSQDDA